MPDDPRLRHHAQNIALQRRHSIDERIAKEAQRETALDDLNRAVQIEEQPSLFQALSSTAIDGEETSPPADDGIDPNEDIVIAAEDLAGLPIDLPPPPKLPGRDVDAKARWAVCARSTPARRIFGTGTPTGYSNSCAQPAWNTRWSTPS